MGAYKQFCCEIAERALDVARIDRAVLVADVGPCDFNDPRHAKIYTRVIDGKVKLFCHRSPDIVRDIQEFWLDTMQDYPKYIARVEGRVA